jgi:putative flippase GtrA
MITRLLSHPLVEKHGAKFFRFAVCGGLGACIDFGTLWFMVHQLHWQEKYAFIISTGLAMIFVFLSNRFFTFKSTDDARGQAAKFFLVYLFAAFLNYCLSIGFFTLGVHYILSKAFAIVIIMFFNYFCLNRFVFKKKDALASEVVAA